MDLKREDVNIEGLLRRLQKESGSKTLANAELKKVTVNKSDGVFFIYLVLTKQLTENEYGRADAVINAYFGRALKVEVVYDYTSFDLADAGVLEMVKDHLYFQCPSVKPFLKPCRMEYQAERLRLYFRNDFALEMFKKLRGKTLIQNHIRLSFHQKVNIVFDIDEQIEKIDPDSLPPDEAAPVIPAKKPQAAGKPKPARKRPATRLVYGKRIDGKPIDIATIDETSGLSVIDGKVIKIEAKRLKNKRALLIFSMTDYTSSIACKLFTSEEKKDKVMRLVSEKTRITVKGTPRYDDYSKAVVLQVKDINLSSRKDKQDNAQKKRVELHLHTIMSAQDSTAKIEDVIERAAGWGHGAVAITDHGVVQAFPDAEGIAKKHGVKIIYGMEAYVTDDRLRIVRGRGDYGLDSEFVVFDIETTGLSPATEEITEIGAVKIQNGEIVDTFSTFVNPHKTIPLKIVEMTGINDNMVANAPEISDVLAAFYAFSKDACLVAHNAEFDMGFIYKKAADHHIVFHQDVIDTLALSRQILKGLGSHRLNAIAKHLKIPLKHHRALNDAQCTARILLYFFEKIREKGVQKISDINTAFSDTVSVRDVRPFHVIVLCKNKTGLENLYRLVSMSHLRYFYRRPRIPKSLISEYREGLIIGSACQQGELYQAILNGAPEKTIEKIISFYDYLEIQPTGNNGFLIREGRVRNAKELEAINKKIVQAGETYRKPVVATGDVHFLDPEDEVFRRILSHVQKSSGAEFQPPLYFRTTEEMLDEFAYLGGDKAEEVVVQNTRKISDMVETFPLLPDNPAMPKIDGADEEIYDMAYANAKRIYGDPLPEIVQKRLEMELHSIIKHGFAVLYLIAHKLVKKSLDDGYLVGSRGSVGSSFAAMMTGITEVNPLPPHYVCPKCRHSDFDVDVNRYGCGTDLPKRNCPKCGASYRSDGYDIPFAVFLGIDADKVPDIDLNFSGEYQPKAHQFIEDLFGKDHVFRAGTINTIQEKTAYGFIKNYCEETEFHPSKAEIERLMKGISGTKRTTGQHPGGLVIVPKDQEIYRYTAVQRPANDVTAQTVTTHFDFNSLHDKLVKLDILGHDDPTMLRMLQDLTGVDPKTIPLNDEQTMKIFSSTDPLGVLPEQILDCDIGSMGIPEFGTRFVRQMLGETRPTTMAELIRISGLSHGEDVWTNNAHDLVKNKTATLSEVICTRDDIMNYLVKKGMEPRKAFFIMESVRRGNGLTNEAQKEMLELDVPDWFIESCNKIQYMFPKAHAVAYVMMALRIAYFKVHCKKEYYAAYFTVRADHFNAKYVLDGAVNLRKHIKSIEALGNAATPLDKAQLTILEVALEMFERGIGFLPVDLSKSKAKRFTIEKNAIRLPFISLDGVGASAAENLERAAKDGKFLSVQDIKDRAKASSAVISALEGIGCLNGMPRTNQLSFF